MPPNNSLPGLLSDIGKNGQGVSLQSGTIIYRDGAWRVFRGGMEQTSVVWLESATPRVGPCLLAIDTPSGNQGQSTVYVLGATFALPFRDQDIAKALTAGSFGKCDVELRNGQIYEGARYMAHYNPSVNDTVFLIWRGGEAYVVGGFPNGHVTINIPKLPALPELPRKIAYGQSNFPASQYNIWDTALGMWSPAKTRDMRITPTAYAVWAYNGMTGTLSDKFQIESGTITFGKRSQFGQLTEDVTVNLYRSDATAFTATEPTLQEGPYPLVIPRDYKGTPLELPLELVKALASGGSITMKSSTALTLTDSPANGFINVKWRNS